MRNWKKITRSFIGIAAMLALLAGVAFAGGQGEAESEGKEEAAQREVIELRMTAGHPYAAAVWVKTLEDFYGPEVSRRVLEETDRYQVEFKGFYGGSLAKLGEVLEAIESGTADIGITNNIFEQSKLEIHNFSWWPPFASGDLEEVIEANAKVMDRVPVFDEVFANYNMKQLGRAFNMNPSFQLVTNFPIKKLEDLKGKKLAHGGSMIPWLKALGAVGVQSTFTDAYTSIDTGVYQGWAMPLNVAMTFKVYEVANYITIIDLGADISGYVCINLDTWNSLPGEVQKIMDEVGYEYSKEIKRRIEVDLSKSLDVMKEAGCTIYTVEEEERARWAKVLSEAQVAQTQAKKADENGLPGTEVLKEYIKALEETGYTWPWRPAEL